jgi:peptide/nickel transport system substrate-binding protein
MAGPSEAELRRWLGQVRSGGLSRRHFVQRLARLGLSAPMAGLMLANAGTAWAAGAPEPPSAAAPQRRGGGGTLRILMWQGPTLLNPHFATGQKDQEGARLFYEPLAAWDAEGRLVPVLAAEIPSRDNGGLAADGRSVTWKLKPGVRWHDGQPFGADDVVFNWQYASDPATAAVTLGMYEGLRIEKIDALSVRVVFEQPTPFWPGTYSRVQLLPRHRFERFRGSNSRDAPDNLHPVGTGPYRFEAFTPGDLLRGTLNPDYHLPARPYFDRVELKGGGDAVSAARAVLQTGEFDFAWNLQVEDDILRRLEAGGHGQVVVPPSAGSVERILLNAADPDTEVDGERASPKTRHPAFSDPAVRAAMAWLVDRRSVQQYVYGRAGPATDQILTGPPRFRSAHAEDGFSVAKANALLDAAGWRRGADGVRAKGGRALRFVFQTSTNGPRQKTQAIVKQAAQQAGIAIELKTITASVFFSSDIANPDTLSKFYADIEMYTNSMTAPDPARFMEQFLSRQIASKANKWQGLNVARWRNDDYDAAYRAAEFELDPVKRAALFIRMNDLVCGDHHVIPVVERPLVVGLARGLVAPQTGWDLSLGFIHDWCRA